MTDDMTDDAEAVDSEAPEADAREPQQSESDAALVKKIQARIKSDKEHHGPAFKRMKRDMRIALHGADPEQWAETRYRANVAGRHVKQKVASLYAKNPKIVAKTRERMEFTVWDETPESLMMAMQTVQAFQAAAAAAAMAPPMMGAGPPPMMGAGPPPQPMPDALTPSPISSAVAAPPQMPLPGLGGPPMMPPEVAQAQAVLDDFQQGMARKSTFAKFSRTLEILFTFSMQTQKPLDFKTALKQVVRRASTTGVGYVKPDFQRETGPREGLSEQMEDYRARLEHLRGLADEISEGEATEYDSEIRELQLALQALTTEPEIVVNEGLAFDYPRSTKVIPDKACKSIVGWTGANWLTVEYDSYTVDDIEEMFPGADLKDGSFTPYTGEIDAAADDSANRTSDAWENDATNSRQDNAKRVLVWEHYDKKTGLCYFVADGYGKFLKEPAAPSVFVEQFFPIYPLTFNECESEDELYPPSDVALLKPMQEEINRSRDGKREHRIAARPKWFGSRGAFTEEDVTGLERAKPFEVVLGDIPPGTKLSDILQAFPVPGVDSNLYDTGEVFSDFQVVMGTQQAVLGGLSKATATESSISASATATTDDAAKDDLDNFLTLLARDCGMILQKEMSEEKVKSIVGPGAVWPQIEEAVGEVYLEVEAGSTGRPNQAVQINNWKTLLPFLLQIPTIKPEWLARETIKRLDDGLDLTEAIDPNAPSIMAMSRLAGQQPSPGAPGEAPDQQGPEGGDKTPSPKGAPTGSSAPMGDNHAP